MTSNMTSNTPSNVVSNTIFNVTSRLLLFCVVLASLSLGGCLGTLRQHHSPDASATPASSAHGEDGRGRFREIYCAVQRDHGATLPYDRPCEDVVTRLDDEPVPTGNPVWLGNARLKLRVMVASGIYSDCINDRVNVFSHALTRLEGYGYRTGDFRVSGRSSSTHNASQIKNALLAVDLLPDERVVLVGYSKGTPDILEAVVAYPEILQKLVAVVSVAGAVGGSPLADTVDEPYQHLLRELPAPHCPPGVGDPIESLKRSTRRQWLSQHRLPTSVKYFSVPTFAGRNDISLLLQPPYDQLATIDPHNDSQLIYYDQIIPGSTLLGYVKADHWAVAMPFSQDTPVLASTLLNKNAFPREVLLEAIIRFVEEALLTTP